MAEFRYSVGHEVELISVSLALSRTPVYTAELHTRS